MFPIHSFSRFHALTLVAALGIGGFHPAQAASLGQRVPMPGASRAAPMGAGEARTPLAIAAAALRITGVERLTVYVLPGGTGLGFIGPDNAHHDTMVPSTFVLRKGTPVVFTVVNFDDMNHSITAPALGVNIIIRAGKDRKDGTVAPTTTTYTFTPTKVGEFRWFCVFPCDMPHHWSMSASYDGPDRDGFMAGIFRVL